MDDYLTQIDRLRLFVSHGTSKPCLESLLDEIERLDAAIHWQRERAEAAEAKLSEQVEWVKRLADDLIAAEGREARIKAKLDQLLEVSKRAVRLSLEHPNFKLYAMEPMERAIDLAEMEDDDT